MATEDFGKHNSNAGPSIAHDFGCTHDPCRCEDLEPLAAVPAFALRLAEEEVERLREALSEAADRIERLDVENERLRAELRRFQRIIIDASEVGADCEDLCGVLCAGPCHALDEIAAISQAAGLDELTGEPPIRRPYPLVGPHQGDPMTEHSEDWQCLGDQRYMPDGHCMCWVADERPCCRCGYDLDLIEVCDSRTSGSKEVPDGD